MTKLVLTARGQRIKNFGTSALEFVVGMTLYGGIIFGAAVLEKLTS